MINKIHISNAKGITQALQPKEAELAETARVHNNPKHRWLRSHKPNWLMPMRGIIIAGRSYDAIGNVNLLALTRRVVHVRCDFSEQERRQECVTLNNYAEEIANEGDNTKYKLTIFQTYYARNKKH